MLATVLYCALTTHPAQAREPQLPMDNCPPLGSEKAQVMVDVDSTFARVAPDYTSATLTRLIKFQCFYATGRSNNGFILVRDGSNRIWLSGTDVRWRGELNQLPLSDDFRAGQQAVITGSPIGLPGISGARAAFMPMPPAVWA